MKRLLLALAVWAGATPAGAFQEAPASGKTPPAAVPPGEAKPLPGSLVPPDQHDLVLFHEHGPLWLRLHALVDDKPHRQAWDDFFRAYLTLLDRNKDGSLNKDEAERALPLNAARLLWRGQVFAQPPASAPALKLTDLDTNKDGKVTLDELKGVYQRAGITALQTQTGQDQNRNAEQLTNVLWKALDQDQDGRLSRAERALAPVSLRKLDVDDDDQLSVVELLPNAAMQFLGFVDFDNGMQRPQRAALALHPVQPGEAGPALAALLKQFDRTGDGKLARSEISLPRGVFDLLDANKDGEIDKAELDRYLQRAPDLEMTLRLGKVPAKAGPLALTEGKAAALAAEARKSESGSFQLSLWRTQLEIRSQDSGPNLEPFRRFYLQQFTNADKDKNKILDAAELAALPPQNQAQALKVLSPTADRDGDGKLTEQELTAFLDLSAQASAAAITVQFWDEGRGLFPFLDANRDGRLNLREVRVAGNVLDRLDRTGTGPLTRQDVPRYLPVTFGRGTIARNNVNPQVRFFNPGGSGVPAPTQGPVWFRKMDHNRDGDLSAREWLGPEEEFRRLDSDGDGLISLDEAKRANVAYQLRKGIWFGVY